MGCGLVRGDWLMQRVGGGGSTASEGLREGGLPGTGEE